MDETNNAKHLCSLIVDEENFIKVAAIEFDRSESTIRTGWLIRGYFPTRDRFQERLFIPFLQNYLKQEDKNPNIQEYLKLKEENKIPMTGKKVMPYWKWKEL